MIRAIYAGGKWLGTEIDHVEEDAENIAAFVREGTPVLLVDSIEDAEYHNIAIELVE